MTFQFASKMNTPSPSSTDLQIETWTMTQQEITHTHIQHNINIKHETQAQDGVIYIDIYIYRDLLIIHLRNKL